MRRKTLALLISICMIISALPISSYSTSNVITGFRQLEQEFYAFEGNPVEKELISSFPTEIVAMTGKETISIPVTWTSNGTYDRYDYYTFTFTPVIANPYILEQDVELPYIIAFRVEEKVETPVEEDQIELIENEGVSSAQETAQDSFLCQVAARFNLYSYADSSAETQVYTFLTQKMGLNMAAACGVEANLYSESGFLANNLQNTYEKSLGLSDEEYTAKVNSGEYTRKQFTSDQAGYGLCQWTSSGRKGNLYDFAKSYFEEKGTPFNIGDRTMQLEYFKKEVSNSYLVTYNTATKVPNLEMGVFLTAFVMCANFEIPANTGNTALARGKAALTGFWDEKNSSKSNCDELTYLGICGYTYPTKINSGVSCKGYIVSNKGINSITAQITDESGKAFCTFTKDYSKKDSKPYYYNLNGDVDDKMSFTKLASEGKTGETYTYSVEATDINGRVIRFDKNFKISSATSVNYDTTVIETSKMALTDATSPGTLKKGDNFEGSGLIKSNYNIKQATVGVKDEKAKTVLLKKSVSPDAKELDISELTKQLDIYTLKGGIYTYYIWAKDEDREKTLLSKQFKVDSKRITSFNYPVSISVGSAFDVKGTVRSDIKITKVYVRVLNSKGVAVTKKTVTPNATSYNLTKLSDYIKFSKLTKGNYTYKVRVTDAVGNTEVVSEPFEVYTPSTLKGYSIAYPKSIKKGKGFTLSGKVKSNYYLQTITVSILNSNGKTVQTKKMDVSSKKYKSYKLANFDNDIKFGVLKKGTYYYKVSAKDERKSKQILKKKFTVK